MTLTSSKSQFCTTQVKADEKYKMKPLLYLPLVAASTHHLFVGTFSEPRLYGLTFTTSPPSLTLSANLSAAAPHTWISLSHNKRALYGSGINSTTWHSYTIHNATSLSLSASVPVVGDASCGLLTGQHNVASPFPPHVVYATAPHCGNILATDSATGEFTRIIQNLTYTTDMASFYPGPYPPGGEKGISAELMHGLALSPNGKFLYGADARNSLWTWSVSNRTGEITLLDVLPGPVPGSNPRHVAIHPKGGRHLYTVLEGANALAQYALNETSGIPLREWTSYPLLPEKRGLNISAYWPDEVSLTESGKYLWATNRARVSGTKGYISAFSVSESGKIEKQLFLKETTTSGGGSNIVTPLPGKVGEEFVALTDTEKGFVQIWRLTDEKNDAVVVAEQAIPAGRCCANVVWYD